MGVFLLATWIYLPRLAHPQLATAGDSLVVIYRAGTAGPLSCRLVGSFAEYNLGTGWGTPSGTLWQAGFVLPDPAEPGIYDLIISTPEGPDTQPNAVMIYPRWKDTVVILQFTDIHIGNSPAELVRFRQAVAEANTLYPDIVVITGDIVERGEDAQSPAWYGEFLSALGDLMVPAFTVNGNHDYIPKTNMVNYPALVNPELNYFFTYSDWLFVLAMNTGPVDPGVGNSRCWGFDSAQIAWADTVLSEHRSFPQKLAMMHGPVVDRDESDRSNTHGVDEFINLSLNHGIGVVLAGHTHYNRFFLADSTWVQGDVWLYPPGPYFLQELSTCKPSRDTLGYRRIEICRDTIISFLEDQDRNGLPDASGSLLLWNLTSAYTYSPDSSVCTVRVVNTSPRTFYKARLWPTMNPGYQYEVLGPGRILRVAPGGFMEVAVDSLPGDDTTTLVISPGTNTGELDPGQGRKMIFTGEALSAFPGQGVWAKLSVYDAQGRLVSVLWEGRWDRPRIFKLDFLRPGSYLAVLQGNGLWQKLVFVR